MKSDRLKGASALFSAAFIYSTFGILIRHMSIMFGDSSQTAARFGIAFIFILLLNFLRKQSIVLPKSQLVKACILGVTFGFVVLLFTISVNNTKIANSVFLLYAGSMISSLLIGTFLLKEKLTIIKAVALGLAFFGIYMYSDALLVMSTGILAGFASGLFDGVSNALRKTLKGINRNSVLTYQFLLSSLVATLAMVLFSDVIIKEVAVLPIVAMIIFAFLQIGLGNLLLYGFQHFDVNVGTVILATELFFATIIGFILFKEVPTSREIIGGVLIFIASILSTVDIKRMLKAVNL
jgi:drug/metabolite transporter (DMT)-like permease